MTVTKEITRLEKSSVKLSISIGKDDVRTEYDGLLSEYTKNMQLPGFRKGKVPKDVLIRKFGSALKDEAVGKIVEKAVGEIFDDEAFPRESRPLSYSTPKLQDNPQLDLENDMKFSLVYDVLPLVKVEKWQGHEVEAVSAAIEDEDITRELGEIQERNAIVLDKDDGAAAVKDDVVTVNYCELDDSGQTVPASDREDFTFTLGSGHNIFKFDDEITGMKKGETKEFSKTYPEDFEDKELAGKTKKLKVSLTALKLKKLPDLDDELAQDVDEKYKTLDDLKNNIRERLGKDLEFRLRGLKIDAIMDKIIGETPVEIPESMLNAELDSRWRNLARRFNTDSAGLYKIMGSAARGPESIIETWKPDAAKALHSRLIIETLIEDLKLEASDEEAEKEIEKIAAESGSTLEDVKKYYESEQAGLYLKEEIKERKVFDLLLEKNTIKAGKKEKYIDLIGKNG